VGGAAFLAADDERKPVLDIVHAVEQREVALARHAESHAHSLRHQRVGEDPAAVARLQVGFHPFTPTEVRLSRSANARRSTAQHSVIAVLAVSTAPPKSTKPCTMSSYCRYAVSTPAAASRSAYAR